MQAPKIKVCGLANKSQIHELIQMEIDFLGFIFYPKSPRYVLNQLTLQEISAINFPTKVGVFVNEELEKLIQIATKAGLSWVQLHGDEDLEYIQKLKENASFLRIIKVFRISEDPQDLAQKIKRVEDEVDYFLFDTDSKAFGGTGKTFDWHILNHLELKKPFFLSGGISLENMKNLSQVSQPIFALDINSKFENRPGDKNLKLIQDFKNNIKNIFK
ncbi:phosphoribosylanthranilate isomerase [Elizabethkingia sp. JS20170427COW]|uniref:phosphoribosylanthranilate isomerase n=1 Tax=Elizabethkingia sp. JS20170427COW TaxID=2583851 RepID=UPI001110C1B4|nr:phosphoribosylanthranilate isomerase [Elizabethkingia sp. JS20170427COW]QCX53972.1 phosphoribosylanthranilate isomerase [Elizabethkingia sp. JS20170427COW]